MASPKKPKTKLSGCHSGTKKAAVECTEQHSRPKFTDGPHLSAYVFWFGHAWGQRLVSKQLQHLFAVVLAHTGDRLSGIAGHELWYEKKN
jgi:hypothetical protein